MTPLTLSGLSQEEGRLILAHLDRLNAFRAANKLSEDYYRGVQIVQQLGIALDPEVAQKVETVVGWPEIGVNTLDERIDLDGFVLDGADLDSLGLPEILADNHYIAESRTANLDQLIYGITFAAVSDGEEDEPHPLITWEPPTRMTAMWDARRRRLSSACSFAFDPDTGAVARATLMLPDQDVIADKVARTDEWVLWNRVEHNAGEVQVVRFVNRPRSAREWGSSEITPAWRSITDSAVRTVLGMEVSREFYSSPQRYALGIGPDDFKDADGDDVPPWQAIIGRFLTLQGQEGGEPIQVGQFNAASPEPYIAQLKGLASMFGAVAALPPSTLGWHTDNPPSGDSQRMYEARLVKRAERHHGVVGPAHARVIRLALKRLHGADVPDLSRLAPLWRDPATPTRASTADATTKYVAAGILPPDSEVTWEMMGLDDATRARLATDVRRARVTALRAGLREQAEQVTDQTVLALSSRGVPDTDG